MKLNATMGAGIGGAAGIILGLASAIAKYDFSKVDQMQQAVGAILADFIVFALVGLIVGLIFRPKK
jgi:hypothetical protein